MNLCIINITTNEVINRSNVRPVGKPSPPNLRIDPLTAPEVVKYRHRPSSYIEDNEDLHTDTEKA